MSSMDTTTGPTPDIPQDLLEIGTKLLALRNDFLPQGLNSKFQRIPDRYLLYRFEEEFRLQEPGIAAPAEWYTIPARRASQERFFQWSRDRYGPFIDKAFIGYENRQLGSLGRPASPLENYTQFLPPSENGNMENSPPAVSITADLVAQAFRHDPSQLIDALSRVFGRSANDATDDATTSRVKASEIGYFHPDAEDHQGEDFWNAGADTYFRDVILFTDRVKDVATTTKWTSLRAKLPQCLRGMATEWYASLIEDTKEKLRDAELDYWVEVLIEEFRDPMSKALRQLQAMRYTLDDAIARKSFRHYAHSVRRIARQAKFNNEQAQLTLILNTVAPELQATLPTITSVTNFKSFADEAESRAELWRYLAIDAKQLMNDATFDEEILDGEDRYDSRFVSSRPVSTPWPSNVTRQAPYPPQEPWYLSRLLQPQPLLHRAPPLPPVPPKQPESREKPLEKPYEKPQAPRP